MARGRGGNDYSSAKNAKDLLDIIGKDVYETVEKDAKTYDSYLKGSLTSATSSHSELNYTTDPCEFKYTKELIDAKDGERYPCKKLSGKEERFSDTLGGQCTYNRIKDSDKKNNSVGACAPYRRLHLCDYNLESISNYNSNARHKLLAEVCYAAKYEGESLTRYHTPHQQTYDDSASQLCTVLARSFADIGDIVRGKDLYLGDKKEKLKLEEKLKQYFKNIHDNLMKDLKKDKEKMAEAQERYKKDKDPDKNYYQLREDWWNANRQQVWEAITCDAGSGNNYFRHTCSDENHPTATQGKCRCSDNSKAGNGDVNIVPTYFDYVPQFLRWFEEWAEDFCRKRKHKLKDAIKKCREGVDGKEKYCDLNRHDCAQTIRGDHDFVEDNECHKCSVACAGFVKWIDNQKLEFDKQKEKYTKEINKKHDKTITIGKTTINNLYVDEFYEKLRENYGKVENFLGKLSEEQICKDKPQASGETADAADFTNEKYVKTFSRTTYCEACPWCGAEKDNTGNGKWKAKDYERCNPVKDYKQYRHTEIPILTSDKKQSGILKKYSKFCASVKDTANGGKGGVGASENGAASNSDNATTGYCGTNIHSSLCEKWICYYKKKENSHGKDINFCVLQDDKARTSEEKSMHYNSFFWDWVYHMLHDSLDWRKQLGNCINKDNDNTCRNNKKCNRECDCFLKWVVQKKTEWKNIKIHFGKQDFVKQDGLDLGMNSPDVVLELLLQNDLLLEIIKDTHANAKEDEIKNIDKMLQETADGVGTFGVGGTGANGKHNTKIDKFLEEEEQFAEKCIKKCPKPEESVLRSAVPSPDTPQSPPGATGDLDNVPEEDDDDDEDDVENAGGDEEVKESKEETPETTASEGPQEEGEQTEEGTKQVEVEPPEAPQEPVPTKDVDPCQIVKELFSNTTKFSDACTLKYVTGKNYGWKCVPTTSSGSDATDDRSVRGKRSTPETAKASGTNQGSICVPPRRRKLYVGKLEEWASDEATKGSTSQVNGDGDSESSVSANKQTQQQAQASNSTLATSAGTSPPSSNPRDDDLRNAFVESAAVETFFLWHRYKKENSKTQSESALLQLQLNGSSGDGDDNDNPQNKLNGGTIPLDFLRQMFYTLADYKDILFSGGTSDSGSNDTSDSKGTSSSSNNNKNIVLEASGSTEEKDKMQKIQQKLKTFFSNSGKGPTSEKKSASDKDPESWWEQHGKHIWKGMVCALTYKENGEKKIVKDGAVYKKFFGDENKSKDGKPVLLPGTTGTSNGTYENNYQYNSVKLDDTSGDDTLNNPKLKNFVEIPTYFRWLHEWGSDFCVKRARMLGKIKEECRGKDGNSKVCSGDGEDCNDQLDADPTIVRDFLCSTCGRHCSFYKKWIQRKKEEFTEQYNAYGGQKTKCQTESETAKEFCGTLNTFNDAAKFLERLKSGPCKNNENVEDNGKDKLDFSKPNETFVPATNCKPCSSFKIDCKKAKCSNRDDTNVGFNCKKNGNGYITSDHIKNEDNFTDTIDMLVSDNSGNGSQNDLNDCIKAGIFKGFRKDEWKCGYKCGYNVCKPENVNGKIVNGKPNGENQIIIIRALFKRWLEYFLEDYNKIRKKLKPCMNNSDGSPCIDNYKKKYQCVLQWISRKEEEWKKIKEHYEKQKPKNGDNNMKSLVTDILSGLYPQTDVNKAIKPCKGLTKFESFCGLNGDKKSKTKDGYQDAIDCMLNRLKDKIGECEKKHGEKSVQTCSPSETPENNLPLPDDEEENIEENPVEQPNICPTPPKETKKEEGDDCKPAATPSEKQTNQTPPAPTQPEPPQPTQPKPPQPAQPADSGEQDTKPKEKAPATNKEETPPQLQSDEPSKPISDILSSTIPFGVALALGSIAFLFLKKKTKSTIDLLRVINIPKSDYDIPTKLSPNRYIPYTSGKYRGKRYIYLEGDSGTDSGYTDHYSDITSSSESEYEELDINDIYAPRAPKYKTLIEVVLEPSGNNTTASGKNTTASGNNTTASGNNTTASDTQNDIPSGDTPNNKITDNEWNTLKKDFISNMLQNTQNTEPNILHDNVDNNTHPTMSRDNVDEKPFIMSIHDRNLYSGEEYSYNVNMSTNSMDDIPINRDNNVYSGIDLINDSLNSGNQPIDIYDELLKRKENELFGTNHVKQTSIHSVAKNTNSDPIHNQLELFHKWLDRHRDMCEQWENHHERLAKLKEQWENETHSGNTHPSDSNKTLNTDVSIQIHMDHGKPKKEFTNMDTILEDLDKYNEPYYDVQDDIYYDVNDDNDISTVDSNNMDIPSKVQIEMDVNTKLVKEKYPIADVWDI